MESISVASTPEDPGGGVYLAGRMERRGEARCKGILSKIEPGGCGV